MRAPLDRVRHGATILGVVSIISVCGYQYFSGQSWLESIYWYVITVSSVGYTEDSTVNNTLQVFSIVVILVGMTAMFYTFGGLVQMLTEGEIERALGVRRANKEIQKLKDHVIVCGFGRMGQILVQDLSAHRIPSLVIDKDPDRIAEAHDWNCQVLSGDSTEEDVLLAAGVERAKTLICGLPSDADNVFITLTSRNLNPDLQIIARGEHPSSEKKLLQAGANRVVLPAATGAQKISRMITRPHTANLIEQVVDREILDVELDELHLTEASPLAGKSVRDAEAHRKHRVLIVAASQPGGETVFNPDAEHVFKVGETIIVMGRTEDIERFRKEFKV